MIATTTTRNGATVISTDDMVLVASTSMPGAYYVLKSSEGWRCECRGYQFRGTCRHRQAVFAHVNPPGQTRIDDAPIAVGTTDPSGLFYSLAARLPVDPAAKTFEALFGGFK